jgi:hypothetical protein
MVHLIPTPEKAAEKVSVSTPEQIPRGLKPARDIKNKRPLRRG